MNHPIAFFLTWNTYGTWLPGDARGWVEYHHGWQLPDPGLELECAARKTEGSCRLTPEQRAAVERQIYETCAHRRWVLHAVNCRSNHIHVVVTAIDVKPRKIRIDLKAWATRCLKQHFDQNRENWWAERGSIRHIYDEKSLEAAILYTTEAQDRKTTVTRSVSEGMIPPVTRSVSEGIIPLITRSVSEGKQPPTPRSVSEAAPDRPASLADASGYRNEDHL